MQTEGLVKSLSFSAHLCWDITNRNESSTSQQSCLGWTLGRHSGQSQVWLLGFFFSFLFLLFFFSLEQREILNSYPLCRTNHGGLLNVSHSSVFSVSQEQTQLRAPAICHLSPALSLQAELWWDRAAAASCRAVSGEAMQKGDYSLLFTIRELGSIWISQQAKNSEEALFPHHA